ncbi:MAG: carboxypeptidase regulatory-like domain-containing protein [Flavobacteriaceae bacterium]
MKKIALLIFSVFCLIGFSQKDIRGVVFNEQGVPLASVKVTANPADKETYTDADGLFSFQVLAAQTLTFSLDGYESFVLVAVVGDEISVSLQPIGFEKEPYQDVQLNIINLSDDELSDENDVLDNISGLLQSTQDVFLRTAAFEFSASFFRVRGLDSDHATVMINGLPMNKLFNGRPQWSNWGGLNDVLRNRELSSGIAPSDYLVGGVLGTTNINTRASDYGKGGRLTFSSSDR